MSTPETVHRHHLDAEQFDTLVSLLARLLPPPLPAAGTPTLEDLAEPWAFPSPRHRGEQVIAFVDDVNQVRHVLASRVDEVPTTWRKMWLAR